jgi:hypothetical protein
VESVKSYGDYFLVEKQVNAFYHDELNPKFWTKKVSRDGKKEKWVLDPIIRKKLLKISKEFYEKFEDVIGKKPIVDIQLTGSLANFNYTDFSDLDLHVLVDFDRVNSPKKVLKSAVDGIRFIWNSRHDIKMRGYDVEVYLQDSKEPHTSSGLFSLMDNRWIRNPKFDPPSVDEDDVYKKAEGIENDINQFQSKLISSTKIPSDARSLYKRANKLKEKIHKMRKEGLSKEGEFSIGNLAFKKLRNDGYIEKLINIISEAYDRIYTE